MKVIIIGAGAAGLTAAINAAKTGAKVTVLEHENKPGKKILVTGNGKCNITNTNLNSEKYYGDKEFVSKILDTFGAQHTIEFFNEMGVVTKDKNGYIYPASEQASTVLNTLRDKALSLGVSIKTNNMVDKIEKTKDGFDVHIGIVLHCDKLIITTGGMSFPKTGSTGDGYKWAKDFGHNIIEPKPALTALACENNSLLKASGVRCHAKVSAINNGVVAAEDIGELQLADYGISGIPVFNISRMADIETEIVIDFMPEIDFDDAENMIKDIFTKRSFMYASVALNGILNEKLSLSILESVNINKSQKAKDISVEQIKELVKKLKEYKVIVKSRRGFDYAQVTQGGIDTNEINSDTMESKLVKGLYFAGEIIDVDGICGGYNLQFAWSTGSIAGRNCFYEIFENI